MPVIPTVEEIETLAKVSLEAWISIKSPSFNPERYTEFSVAEKGDRKIELVSEADIDPKVDPPVLFKGFRKNIDFGQEGTDVPAVDKFYFRLSGNNIYYCKNDKDLVVLGAINVKNVHSTGAGSKTGEQCFLVFDDEEDKWELCTESADVVKEWVCAIKTILKQPCEEEKKAEVKVVKEVKEEVILYQTPSPFCNENWNYMHHGEDWDCQCAEGLMQSPIDINPNTTCNPYSNAP